jgi:hypothetical protein
MPVLGFNDFADVTENGRRIEPRHNRKVGISVDRGFLYINDNAFVTGCAGFSGAVLMSSGTEMFWGEGSGTGATGLQGATGPSGGEQGATGLGNFTQKSDFNVGVYVPELMWNFIDETFYGYVTGVNKWVQVSSGSLSGFTGAQGTTGVAGVTGAYGGPPGVTGLQGAIGLQGPTGSQGITGPRGLTGAVGLGATGLQGATGPSGGSEIFIGVTGAQGFTGYYISDEISIPPGTVLFDYHIAINGVGSVAMGFTGLSLTPPIFFSNVVPSGSTAKTYNSSLGAVTMGGVTPTSPLILIGTGYKRSSGPVKMIFSVNVNNIVSISPGSYIRYRVL